MAILPVPNSVDPFHIEGQRGRKIYGGKKGREFNKTASSGWEELKEHKLR